VALAVLVFKDVAVPVTALESEKIVDEPLVPAITNLSSEVDVPDRTTTDEFSRSNLTALLRFGARPLVPAPELLNSIMPDVGRTSTFTITIYYRILYQYSMVK
jgi:hypothetical protein